MFFTGFADEAARDLDGQIEATKALGWSKIESRNIDGKNIHDISEADFEVVQGKLKDAGIEINCFGSAIANWSKDPTNPEDTKASLEMLDRALPRMKKLGTTLLRGMSCKMMKDRSPQDPDVEKSVFSHLKEMVTRCQEHGITYGHENCMNYGGQSYEHSIKLVEAMDSDSFTLIFDTGNPPITDLRIGEPPYAKQSSWDFYKGIKEHIGYVHIKDATFIKENGNIFPDAKFFFPGEGSGDIPQIVKDLLDDGYDGGFSMEPHMSVVFHDDANDSDKSQAMKDNYIEYGRRFMKLVDEAKAS